MVGRVVLIDDVSFTWFQIPFTFRTIIRIDGHNRTPCFVNGTIRFDKLILIIFFRKYRCLFPCLSPFFINLVLVFILDPVATALYSILSEFTKVLFVNVPPLQTHTFSPPQSGCDQQSKQAPEVQRAIMDFPEEVCRLFLG